MSGVNARYQHGPRSYQVSAPVKGGQVVVPDGTTGKIKPCATAAAANVLGVALNDAQPVADQSSNTTSYGAPVVDASVPQDYTAVASSGDVVPVKYSGNVAFGAKVVADATGGVVGGGATPAAGTIVGVCDEPAGVVSGAVGLTRIY